MLELVLEGGEVDPSTTDLDPLAEAEVIELGDDDECGRIVE
jgi:hypothetical protein